MTNTLLINPLSWFSLTRTTERAAKSLIKKAMRSCREAEEHLEYGVKVSRIVFDYVQDGSPASVAAWHYQQGLWKFRDAIAKLEQTRHLDLSRKYKRHVQQRLDECFKNAQICKLLHQGTSYKRS